VTDTLRRYRPLRALYFRYSNTLDAKINLERNDPSHRTTGGIENVERSRDISAGCWYAS
jgi:hypothetical protein